MPAQSRGFWACAHCGLRFDRYEEAIFHENSECSHRRGSVSKVSTPPTNREEISPITSLVMPPFDDKETSVVNDHYQQPYEHTQQTHTNRKMGRRFPLMGLHEPNYLNHTDSISCKNVEIFEVTDQYQYQDQAGNRPVTGQLGLRCMNCPDNSSTASQNYIFPGRVDNLANSVRMLAERHMTMCSGMPVETRQMLEQAARKRQLSKNEGGPSWHEEESYERMLIEFCSGRCQGLGITNKYPDNTGIAFRDDSPTQYNQSVPASNQSQSVQTLDAERTAGMSTIGPTESDPMAPSLLTRRDDRAAMPNSSPHGGGQEESYAASTQAAYGHGMSYQGTSPMLSSKPDMSRGPVSVAAPGQDVSAGMGGYQQMAPFDMPNNFPFIQESNGDWICKFCSHLHPQYRSPQYKWSTANNEPPPNSYIDHHLNQCQSYFQTTNAPQSYGYHQAPSRSYDYMNVSSTPYSHHQSGWEASGEPRGPPTSYASSLPSTDYVQRPGLAAAPSPYAKFSLRSVSPKHSEPPRRRSSLSSKVAVGKNDIGTKRAIDFLAANDKSLTDIDGNPVPEVDKLVLEEDKLLLTNYFYHMMKQLRLVRFSEADRKTRGGKREKIHIGYGGLQCVHCADAPNARKFFWSNVDRLANSFAEIPGHILKCRRCPQPIKDALYQLKQCHPEQMARLPRGSQKVFFRRMWRRIHPDPDPDQDHHASESMKSPPTNIDMPVHEQGATGTPEQSDKQSLSQATPPGTSGSGSSGSTESVILLERPTHESAKALADASVQNRPPSPSSRVLLAVPEDQSWLSERDCFVRRQLEVFCATKEDVITARADRKYPVHEGQVGIRCIHCALTRQGQGAAGQAVAFPFAVSGIYESVREFQRVHLDSCNNLPPNVKSKLSELKGSSSLSSVLRKYYVLAAKSLGLQDTPEGIRAGGESVPLGSQTAFAFSEGTSNSPEEMQSLSEDLSLERIQKMSPHAEGLSQTPESEENRKRRLPQESEDNADYKKPYTVAMSPQKAKEN